MIETQMSAAPVMTGFFGKLPCRADFLRGGLPSSFVAAWDGWMSSMLAASRARMGEGWLPAWTQAPVWRFLLPAGQCGPDGALGLWLPSVDTAGRYFPLMIAAVFPGAAVQRADRWLDAAEEIGRSALEFDTEPADLSAALDGLPTPWGVAPGPLGAWWTAGAPRVAAGSFTADALPTADRFAAMLGAGP